MAIDGTLDDVKRPFDDGFDPIPNFPCKLVAYQTIQCTFHRISGNIGSFRPQ